MGFVLSELKRRHVFRVAFAYCTVSWIVLEVSATAFPPSPIPEWSLSLILLVHPGVTGGAGSGLGVRHHASSARADPGESVPGRRRPETGSSSAEHGVVPGRRTVRGALSGMTHGTAASGRMRAEVR
jgi:hypothetical protein